MTYTERFFDRQQADSRLSAEEVVPHLLRLVKPASVVDVGCGVGTWLSVFVEHGVEDICGIDGDWVPSDMLWIDEERFIAANLTHPLELDRSFDLAMSLEVAEHLPESAATTFVRSLCALAPVIAFSAAIPMQGGANHVNEQWPTYWVELFRAEGWLVIDAIRSEIWNNDRVAPWYRQNLLVFVNRDEIDKYPLLASKRARVDEPMLSVVHPWFCERWLEQRRNGQWRQRTPLRTGLRRIVGRLARRVRMSAKSQQV